MLKGDLNRKLGNEGFFYALANFFPLEVGPLN